MKFREIVLVSIALTILSSYSIGQVKDQTKYRRSNLTMVLVEDNDLGKSKDMVINAYNSNPFPDKYNQHIIQDKKFSTDLIKLSISDYKNAGFYNDTLKTPLDFIKAAKRPFNPITKLNAEGTLGVVEPSKPELINMYIDKYIKEKKVAKQIAATWFNRKPNGDMDWELLKERAMYSATADEEKSGTKQNLVDRLIKDVDIIGNSYVVFNKMEFYANEPVARLIRDAAKNEANKQLAGKPAFLLEKALSGIDKVYETTKEGYTVKCNTYLYQLDWNEQIAKTVNNLFFNNNNLADRAKIWDTTNIFNLKFVGKTTVFSIVTFKLGEKRTEEQIITLQVKRTMDNALAKLQKEYVQFRPVSPIASVNPLTAKIGLKEGLEPGQKFELLKIEFDEFNIPKYKNFGSVTVDKKAPIWDNRQGAEPQLDAQGNPIPEVPFTTFKGGKKAEAEINFIRLVK
jgi:hypothetical protein